MILSAENINKLLGTWLQEQMQKFSATKLILTGPCNSEWYYLNFLCHSFKIPVLNLTFGYSPTDIQTLRMRGLNIMNVHLKDIDDQLLTRLEKDQSEKSSLKLLHDATQLQAGLRHTVTKYIATQSSGLLVGTNNRNELGLMKHHRLLRISEVDFMPLGELYRSEVLDLLTKLLTYEPYCHYSLIILESDKTQVIGETEITYEEAEWADRENQRVIITLNKQGPVTAQTTWSTGIVQGDSDPSKHPFWLGYTGRQRTVIGKLHSLEKKSRACFHHFVSCPLRSQPGLVQ